MRICMISESFLPVMGGLQFQLKYITEEMGKNSEIFLLSYSDGEKYLKKSESGFPKFIKLKYRNRILGMLELIYLINKISPQVIHVHLAEINAFQVALIKFFKIIRKPLIITSHGSDIMTYPQIGYGIRLKPFFSKIVNFVLGVCDQHILVGKSMRPFAIDSGSDPKKILEINNGIPLDNEIDISEKKKLMIMEKFGISDADIILLSLSGLRPLKGVDVLIKSFAVIIKEIPNAKLLLACSSGTYEKRIKKMVRDMNLEEKVKFIGFVTDEGEKVALLRRCDIFCKPSRLEACSVAILEAMREGKVVIASIPGGIDIIQDQIDGILVPVENYNAYAEAVIRVLRDSSLRKKLEENAKRNINNFNISKIASQYLNLYSELSK